MSRNSWLRFLLASRRWHERLMIAKRCHPVGGVDVAGPARYPTTRSHFPWSVGWYRDHPRIFDADGRIVADILSGGYVTAERICKNCNEYARQNNIKEI